MSKARKMSDVERTSTMLDLIHRAADNPDAMASLASLIANASRLGSVVDNAELRAEILRLRAENERQITAAHETAAMWYHEAESLRSELSRSRSVGLPPDESPQRDAVCDALTEALIYIGIGCDEACERTSVNLLDAAEIRGLARMLTVRDAEGRDGSLGENTQRLWQRIADAVCPSVPNTGTALSEEERAFIERTLTEMRDDDDSAGCQLTARATRQLIALFERLAPGPADE